MDMFKIDSGNTLAPGERPLSDQRAAPGCLGQVLITVDSQESREPTRAEKRGTLLRPVLA